MKTVVEPPTAPEVTSAIAAPVIIMIEIVGGKVTSVMVSEGIVVSHVVAAASASDGQSEFVRFRCDGEVVPFTDAPSPGSRRRIPVSREVVHEFHFQLPITAFAALVYFAQSPPIFAV